MRTLMRLCLGIILVLSIGTVAAQDDRGNLLPNGDFSHGMDGWTLYQPCTLCQMNLVSTQQAPVSLVWERTNSGGSGSLIAATHALDIDVSAWPQLLLELSVRVDSHSLTNSGWWSDENAGSGEYPFFVRLTFLDANNQSFEWIHGALSVHDGSTRLTNFTLVSAGVWTPLEFDVLAPGLWVDPRGNPLPAPARLTGITVGGSGWDFQAAVQGIRVMPDHMMGSGFGDTMGDGTGDAAGDTQTGGDLTNGTGGTGSDQDQAAGFIVEEYPLVAATEDQPTHFEFRDRVTPAILAVREAWREPAPTDALAYSNAVLGSFGYALAVAPPPGNMAEAYVLTHGGDILIDDITAVFPMAANASNTDFRLIVDSLAQGPLLVTADTVGKLNTDNWVFLAPVYAGDDLIEVQADWDNGAFHVTRNGTPVYTVVPQGAFVEPPVHALWSWNGQWVLEAEDDVIIDGQSLNAQLGTEQVFGWRLIRGEPFFFFVQNGQTGMSYAGQVLPYQYDEVQHYRCCEEAIFNAGGNNTMVWFYALRDGIWTYVEGGVYL